jgi:hypothetical protein
MTETNATRLLAYLTLQDAVSVLNMNYLSYGVQARVLFKFDNLEYEITIVPKCEVRGEQTTA